MPEEKKFTIPVAIILAGALIAGALYFTNRPESVPEVAQQEQSQKLIPSVTADDHILGSPDADIIIVEYSDFECPFCKNFHTVMHQIIDEFGGSGQVAWVYRHFPITQLHSKAVKEAEASECAAEIGGNQGFWDYADRLFEITPSNNNLDSNLLPQIAEDIGLDRDEFKRCLDSGRYQEKIQTQYDEVIASGGRGTPHNVIIAGAEQAVIEGAQPIEAMRQVIRSLLNDTGVQSVPVVPTQ